MARRTTSLGALLLLLGLVRPTSAHAQWYVGTYTGANQTRPAAVTIEQPKASRLLTFHDVEFETRPFASPQYYGARIGRLFAGGRLGIEIEFLHTKMIASTDRRVRVTGSGPLGRIDDTFAMDAIVQRYAMTHGLNFWLGNFVWQQPLGNGPNRARVVVVLRAGAGPVVPGVDSVVDHVSVQGYQYAGLGGQVSAGADVHLFGMVSATGEYKLTGARPRIDIAGGTGRTTAVGHHLTFGLALRFQRH